MELFNEDTGESICRNVPTWGTLRANATGERRFEEEGYLALPPCLWGDEPGLHPSVLLPKGTPLVSIKKNRNTHSGHYGEMASWQMRGTAQ